MSQLILVIGLPGSGKSTIAGRLAVRLEAAWISSDAIRAECGLRGDYRSDTIARVYREMMERAGPQLAEGLPVILDGSFSSRRFREQAQSLAERSGASLAIIHMVADERTSLRRVGRKRKLTEAGPEAYRLLKEHFDPLEGEHLRLDSSWARPKRLLAKAERYLAREREPGAH